MKNYALRITLIYLAVGILWILLSDMLVEALSKNLEVLAFFQRIKGVVFVLLTSLLIYLLMRKFYASEQKSRQEYEQVFMNFLHPMWIYDPDSLKILAVNKAAVNTYGYSFAEFGQLSLPDIHPPEEEGKLKTTIKSITASFHNSGKWRHRKKNGEDFYVEVCGIATRFKDKPARMVLSIDVNEIERARQKILEQNSRLRKIAQLQAHDIRGPLASIMGLITIFDKSGKDFKGNLEVMESFELAAHQLDDVVTRIIYTSQETDQGIG